MKSKYRIKRGLAFKFSLTILSCVVVTFLAILIYNYNVSHRTIIESVEQNTKNLSSSILNQIKTKLYSAQEIPENVAVFIETTPQNEKELKQMLSSIVKGNPEIYGSTISYEPYQFDKSKYWFGPYYYHLNDSIKYSDLGKGYDYFKWNWYKTPKSENRAIWSKPYFDEGGGNILMITYSVPFYRSYNNEKKFTGIVTIDISLEFLQKYISQFKIFDRGYIFMITGDGSYIAHPNSSYILKETIFSVSKKYNDKSVEELGKKMISGKTGFEEYYSYSLNEECKIFYAPLDSMGSTGWSIGVVIPKDELFSELYSVTKQLFFIGLIGYILTLFLIIFFSNRITLPLRKFASATVDIGDGDFNAYLPDIKSKDEIGVLSNSFKTMQSKLIDYIANLKTTTAAKEKIEQELSIAREIQESIIPHHFPKAKEFELFALLKPARDVGGDLYDFFMIDDDHLCFAIGDVSGKGVPAALFMAITKTLLRAKASITLKPDIILMRMNNELCKDNDTSMFVTFFLGILNIRTGELEYCNAGHNPPLIHREKEGFNYFNIDKNIPLGITENFEMRTNTMYLKPEDIFFLYTDGVTEAMDPDNQEFSDEKLLNTLSSLKDESVTTILKNLLFSVEMHAGGADQSDDITMMVVKFTGE
jgi:sigma-B regulation protein RsbU (phosphoserine phosphatase)